MANIDFKVNFYPKAKNSLKQYPDKVMYMAARVLLDRAYPTIPLSNMVNSGKLRQTSMSAGVRGSNGEYYVGSYTNYAAAVYTMEDRHNVNWTTPGTNGKWYKKVWDRQGKAILKLSMERNEIK